MIDQGPEWGYFPELAKSLFIANNPEEKEVAERKVEQVGLNLNYIDGSQYLGSYLGPREELEEWVWPNVESREYGVRTLAKIA